MNTCYGFTTRRVKGFAVLALAGAMQFGFLESCDDRLIGFTRFADPCGTILTCAPGSFETNAADIGDPCIDPACVIPGGCGGGQPLGTITDLPGC